MPTPFELVAGGLGIVLGLAWVIWPTRMRNLQLKYLYLGAGDAAESQSSTEALLGRLTGAVLAVLGAALVFGLTP